MTQMSSALLVIFLTLITKCHGFSLDKAVWDSIPSLDTERRPAFDRLSNGKMQLTGMDKVLQASDSKRTTRRLDEPAPEEPIREKRSDDILHIIETGSRVPENIKDSVFDPFEEFTAVASRDSANPTRNIPRNVVILFIDETEHGRGNHFGKSRPLPSFPMQGSLESCQDHDLIKVNSSTDDKTFSQQTMRNDCACKKRLQEKLTSLLSYARRVKKMSTGTVSTTNFSIPFVYESDDAFGEPKQLEQMENNVAKRKSRASANSELKDLLRLNDKHSSLNPPITTLPNIKRNTNEVRENPWDLFGALSKIRFAFFRALFDSFCGSLAGSDDKCSSRRPFPLQSSATELIADTIKELKSIRNNNGYMLIAVAPENEYLTSVELIRHETLSPETLLVVSGICSLNTTSVPFFAEGPGSTLLLQTTSVSNLLKTIENILVGGCPTHGCRNRLHDLLTLQPSLRVVFPENDAPHKRTIRDGSANNKSNIASAKNTNDSTTTEGRVSRSIATEKTVDTNMAIIGIVASFCTFLLLNST